MRLFYKPEDYLAFERVLGEGLERRVPLPACPAVLRGSVYLAVGTIAQGSNRKGLATRHTANELAVAPKWQQFFFSPSHK